MFIKLICTAKRLEKKKLDLLQEKHGAWNQAQDKEAAFTLGQKYRRRMVDLRRRCTRCCSFPKHSFLYRRCFNLRRDGTCENYTAKSVAGFFGGFCLTYVFFMFFVLQLNFKLSTATIMCSIFGSILTIGLAFSFKVRCIVFLVLPQFFSKKGRQALLAYAFILAITGPAKNTLNNMSILGESMACGQEQLKAAVRQILEVIKKPFYAIRDAIKAVVKTVKEIVVKIKEILLTIKRIIMSLIKVIKSAFEFIANIMNFCNKEIGTPYQRCKSAFEDAITDCNAKLGPLFNWLCNITYLVKSVCYIVKLLDYVCMVVDFIKDTVSTILLRVKQFVRHIRTMFYVRIKFSHSFHYESNHSKSMTDITTGIVTELKQRTSGLIRIFDFMSCAASLFFIFMVFKVIYYRHKFLTNERFDNKFITDDFRKIDLRRAQMGLETVLPLNHRERQQYITTSSVRLITKEKSQLSQSTMVLLMASMKLLTHMATDYSLYWIMTLIRYYGRFQSKIEAPNVPTLKIQGEGFLAKLLKGIVKAFQPIGLNLEVDTIPCLPDPIPPDYDRYIQIASLLVLCWFLALFEPYGLRFRHSVMCFYHPQRARERSIWLYNNILRSRSSFLKFARRQLRRKVKGDKRITKITCMEYLRANLKCRICRWILGEGKQEACLLCGEVFREGVGKKPIKCQTPDCPGIYCEQCFADLQNLCTVCLDPIQYGDISDISEEKDSSEDDEKQRKKVDRKKKFIKRKQEDFHDDNDEDDYDDDRGALIRKTEKDLDYFSSPPESSGNETDYSYTYQTIKDITKPSGDYRRDHFKDLEEQGLPNQASMDDFHGDTTDITTDFDSSSSHITEFKSPSSLQHLNTSIRPTLNDHGSKLSLLNSSPSQNSVTTPTTSLVQEEISSHPQDDLTMINLFAKRTNSKISTESIAMEEIPTDSTMQGTSVRQPLSSHTETTFILSPRRYGSNSNLSSTGRTSRELISKTSLITELENVREAIHANITKQILSRKRPEIPMQGVKHPYDGLSELDFGRDHPDVPNLNLEFLQVDENTGTVKTCCCTKRHYCNCKYFKNSVTYRIDSDSSRNGESSSFITEILSPKTNLKTPKDDNSVIVSSILKTKRNPTFTVQQAISPISIEPGDSPITSTYPESYSDIHREVRFVHPEKSATTSSSTSTYITDPYDFGVDPILEPIATSSSSNYFEEGLRQRRMTTKDELYRQRIKDYYRKLKYDYVRYYEPPPMKMNPIKKFINLFRKKNKKLYS
ncbi:PREDICTED: DC-STAMP domain-containing protein 2-like [Nicrophorus vespilloides]|uniref:DC-STAMP domain-containing protein 2-like n=1 Tax=Nicrophorus vespilloides TaxID=110193 RepID=A0ABM1N861_NICVS|nr:PREDICTED: DC-STAMP domain-containing protein 2-like [Nicrophorus vespilloides]